MSDSSELSITYKTKDKPKSLDFLNIKRAALGKKYELSLVFIGDKLSKKLNKIHRGKDKPTNILSFSLSKTSGEIFINLPLIKKQAKKFERKIPNFILYLFIHGLMHLNGFEHGDTMEKAEQRLQKKFKI